MTRSRPNGLPFVQIDMAMAKTDQDVVASIGPELQHAVKVSLTPIPPFTLELWRALPSSVCQMRDASAAAVLLSPSCALLRRTRRS